VKFVTILSEDVFTHHDDLIASLNKALYNHGIVEPEKYIVLTDYMARGAHFLVLDDIRRAKDEWDVCLLPFLPYILGAKNATTVREVADEVTYDGTADLSAETVDPEDEELDLCNDALPFKVKRGRKYGLVGLDSAAKSTFMKAITEGNLQGFPTSELVTVYVECKIIGEKSDMTVIDYIMTDAKIVERNVQEPDVRAMMLTDMGFGVSRTAAAIEASSVGTLVWVVGE